MKGKKRKQKVPKVVTANLGATPLPGGEETKRWTSLHSYMLLAVLTLLCLLPYCDEAFRVDDSLFVWAGKQIIQHPSDPYGFSVFWYAEPNPMSEVTENPPIAAYYIAAVARTFGWSERALHLSFLLPALIVILGTHYLGQRFTRNPLLA